MITYDEAKKWYTKGIEDANGSIGDGIDADFYDQYRDQFTSDESGIDENEKLKADLKAMTVLYENQKAENENRLRTQPDL